MMHGGDLVASVLHRHNVKWIFTLCGGHISPILTACKEIGIQVISVRHEVTAVFAADAISRLSGRIGVAVVTAGPGLTNTITAMKNAQQAQVPVLILGGAAATVLKGRGSLQDMDHLSLVRTVAKLSKSINQVRDIQPMLEKVIYAAQSGVPGPVYLELPVDLLYPEPVVKEWYGLKAGSKSMPWWMAGYLKWNVNRLFRYKDRPYTKIAKPVQRYPSSGQLNRVVSMIKSSQKPLLLIGSQAMLNPGNAEKLADSIKTLNVPTYVSGTARGMLSKTDLPIFRHMRKKALKEADMVILAGVPCDFRLDYGRHINHRAKTVSVNLSRKDMNLNRIPTLGIKTDSAQFLIQLNKNNTNGGWKDWHETLHKRNKERLTEISRQAKEHTKFINPLKLFSQLNKHLSDGDILVADGGDFVATASYILRPRSLMGWLDPGVFGTLGVGAGFILGAHLTHPYSVVWAIFGDGAFGYSLTEFDTFARHGIPVVAVIGNDAGWNQIARDQVEILKDPVGTELAATDYHKAVEALGGVGYFIDAEDQIADVLTRAKESCLDGKPVVVNVRIAKIDFRKGSISM